LRALFVVAERARMRLLSLVTGRAVSERAPYDVLGVGIIHNGAIAVLAEFEDLPACVVTISLLDADGRPLEHSRNSIYLNRSRYAQLTWTF
jgi:hypothetical protein